MREVETRTTTRVEGGIPGLFKVSREWTTESIRERVAEIDDGRIAQFIARAKHLRARSKVRGDKKAWRYWNDVIAAAEERRHNWRE